MDQVRSRRVFLAQLMGLILAGCGGGSPGSSAFTPVAANLTPPPDAFTAVLSAQQAAAPEAGNAWATLLIDPLTGGISATVLTTLVQPSTVSLDNTASGQTLLLARAFIDDAGNSVFSGQTTLTQAQAQDLRAGLYEVVVATPSQPQGQLRGKLLQQVQSAASVVAAPSNLLVQREVVFVNAMKPSEVVPPSSSTDGALALVRTDAVARTMLAVVTLRGAPALEVSIHAGAAGSNGPALFLLQPAFTQPQVWLLNANLTDSQSTALLGGQLYVTSRSEAFPNGQLRAQITG